MSIIINIFFLIISVIFFYTGGNSIWVAHVVSLSYIAYIIREKIAIKSAWYNPRFIFTLFWFILVWCGYWLIKFNLDFYYLLKGFSVTDDVAVKTLMLLIISLTSYNIGFILLRSNNIAMQKDKFTNMQIANKSLIVPFIASLLAAFIWINRSGLFGHFVEEEATAILNASNMLYNIIIMLVCIMFVARKYTINILLIVSIAIVSYFSLISGSKFHTLFPLLMLILLAYKNNMKLFKSMLIGFVCITLFVFAIMPAIRSSIFSSQKVELANVQSDDESSLILIGSRLNYFPQLQMSLNANIKSEEVDNMWFDTFMSPIYAVAPSFIFPIKPKMEFAKEYSYQVMRSNDTNNISASLPGMMYLNGKLVSVIFGMILFGLFNSGVYIYLIKHNLIFVVYILLYKFTMTASTPWNYYVGIIQSLIVFIVLSKFFTRNK